MHAPIQRPLFLLPLALLVTGAARAEGDPLVVSEPSLDRPAAPLAVDRSRLHFDAGPDGVWVRGRTYKARFADDGCAYVPFLGSSAPRNFPVRFQLVTAEVDGGALQLESAPRVARQGERVVIERGPVRAIYDVALESIEQSFALDAAGTSSDAVLRLGVETELAVRRDGEGLRFENEHGAVLYSGAVALDAAGRRVSVPVEFVEGGIALRVPGSFLARAEGEILVDPIVSTYAVDVFTGDQTHPDVAYSRTGGAYVSVFEEVFSSADRDVYCVARDALTGDVDGGAYIELGTGDWTDPSIAVADGAGVALVVATVADATPSSLEGRLWDLTADDVLGDSFGILTLSAPLSHVDVGGTSDSTPDPAFLVVAEADFGTDRDVVGVSVSSSGAVGSTFGLTTSTVNDSFMPAVSESTGDPLLANRWNVAYADEDLTTGNHTVFVAQYDATGTLLGPPVEALPGLPEPVTALDVSDLIEGPDGTPEYLVVFSTTFSGLNETLLVRVQGTTSSLAIQSLPLLEHAPLDVTPFAPRLATTDDRYLVAYHDVDAGSGLMQPVVSVLDPVGDDLLAVADRRLLVDSAGPGPDFAGKGGIAIASGFSGGLFVDDWCGVVFERQTAQGVDLFGATVEPIPQKSVAWQFCWGTENSTGDRGFLRMTGGTSVFSQKQLFAEALPPLQFALLVVGTEAADVPMVGGGEGTLCIGGTIGRYNAQIQQVSLQGSVGFLVDPLSIPLGGAVVSATAGDVFGFQVWHRDVGGAGATSNLTNAVAMGFE